MAGLTLMCDQTVACFQKGCNMLDFLVSICQFRGISELVQHCEGTDGGKKSAGAFHPGLESKLREELRGLKLKVRHTGHTKKFKGFGGAANSKESEFPKVKKGETEAVMMTVADYFADMAANSGENNQYKSGIGADGRLKYPGLPCINVGSKKRPILIPPELIDIPSGQPRHKVGPEIVSQVIKKAAVPPQQRSGTINNSSKDGIMFQIRHDLDAKHFGVGNLNPESMAMPAKLLPPPKLLYRDGRTADPGLKGQWNPAGKFSHPPKHPSGEGTGYLIAAVYCARRGADARTMDQNKQFVAGVCGEAETLGVRLTTGGNVIDWNADDKEALFKMFVMFKNQGVRLVIMLMRDDCYNSIKVALLTSLYVFGLYISFAPFLSLSFSLFNAVLPPHLPQSSFTSTPRYLYNPSNPKKTIQHPIA